MTIKIIKKIIFVLFCFGLFLLALNFLRFIFPLRNPEIYNHELRFQNDIQLAEKESWERIELAKNKNDKEFAEELNTIIHNSLIHYWEDEKKKLYKIEIPIQENYILFLFGKIAPKKYGKWEYCNYKKALQRGVGLCSQHAIIMNSILEKQDIPSKIISLNGHVVISAQVDNYNKEWWVFDPDYGVTIKNNIKSIEANPEIIRPFYAEKEFSDKTIDNLISIYGNNKHYEYICAYSNIEKYSYILIWLTPLIFITPFIILKIKKIYEEKSTSSDIGS